jgi:methionyl-tRNA formyltransferase
MPSGHRIKNTMSKSIVFLGSKKIGTACLRHLHDFCLGHDHEIVGVFTNPRGQEIKDYCAENTLATYDDLDQLASLPRPDFIVSVQYHKIMKARHLDAARTIAVNLHMAPLPEYRGCNQFSFAIINGDEEFGTTIHQMDPGIDSGGIIFERRFPIPRDCFAQELYQITFEHSVEMFRESLPRLVDGDFEIVPQESLLPSRTTSLHYRKEIEELKEIDLDWPKERILRHVRATAMPGFAPPFVRLQNSKIELNVIIEK